MKAPTPLMVVVLAAIALAPGPPAVAQSPISLVVEGVLKDALGAAAIGETVYFAAVTNGRAALEYSIKDGATTGVLYPQAKTDQTGHFRIELRADQVPAGRKFALGHSQGWFVRDTGAVGVFDIPPLSPKGEATRVNVGTVVW